MTNDELKTIRDRCDKASKLPWRSVHKTDFGGECGHADVVGPAHSLYRGIINVGHVTVTNDDGDFIAAAREDVPKLLDEIEASREIVDAAKKIVATVSERSQNADDGLREAVSMMVTALGKLEK